QREQEAIGPRRHEIFFREHLDRVGQRVEQPQDAQPYPDERDADRSAVGADAVLHDRRLLALDPGQDPAEVEHEHHDEEDAPEDDAEVGDHAWAEARWPGGGGRPDAVAPAASRPSPPRRGWP